MESLFNRQTIDLLYEMSIVVFVRYIYTLDYSHIGLTAKHFILKKEDV
jgi:hypothetical protein